MSLRVEYAPRSVRDLIVLRDYLIEESESPETAERFLARLLSASETLDTFPERFPRYPYSRDWRMMPFGNYLIFFRVTEDTVRIGHIRHAAKRPFRG